MPHIPHVTPPRCLLVLPHCLLHTSTSAIMSQQLPNLHTVHITRYHSPKHIHTIQLPTPNPTITTLHHAASTLYSLPHHPAPALTFHYRDEEGDLVRMDTTAELVEVLKEKAEAGERLLLIVGQASEDVAAAVSDADSDDSDSFVRVDATDFMPYSPSAATSSHSSSYAVPQSAQGGGRTVSEPETRSQQLMQTTTDVTEVTANDFTQPSNPSSAATTATVQPAAQPAVNSELQSSDATEQSATSSAETEVKKDADIDEKQQQPEPVQPLVAPKPPLASASPPAAVIRPRRSAATPAFMRPLVASANSQLSQVRRVVNRVGHRWLSEVQTVLTPRMTQLWAALSGGMLAVKSVMSARPRVLLFAVVLVMALLWAKSQVLVSRGRADPSVARLEARINAIEKYGQKLLADSRDTTDTIFTLGNQLSQATQRIDSMQAELLTMERERDEVRRYAHRAAEASDETAAWLSQYAQPLHTVVQEQQLTFKTLQQQLNEFIGQLDQLKAAIDNHKPPPQQQPSAHSKPTHKRRSWLDNDWPQKADVATDSYRSDVASLYDDSIEDLILASVFEFDSSAQEELQPYNNQQSSKQRKSDTRRAAVAPDSPSSALWGEPSRFATSVAWSSPTSAQSYSSAGLSYSSSSSSSASSTAVASSGSKSARAERAERRERRKQDRENVDSLWSLPSLGEFAKPAAAATPPPPPASTTSTSTSSCTSSRSSTCADKHSHHKSKPDKSDRHSSSSTCASQPHHYSKKSDQDKKSLKNVGKKIGKALQTVNDAAKRVWKAWKSQW